MIVTESVSISVELLLRAQWKLYCDSQQDEIVLRIFIKCMFAYHIIQFPACFAFAIILLLINT